MGVEPLFYTYEVSFAKNEPVEVDVFLTANYGSEVSEALRGDEVRCGSRSEQPLAAVRQC